MTFTLDAVQVPHGIQMHVTEEPSAPTVRKEAHIDVFNY